MDHEEQKETIYFLEWLAHESGFTENQILNNMRPENQKWVIEQNFFSIKNFLEKRTGKLNWINYLFNWSESILNVNYYFWRNLSRKWEYLVESNKYNIEFSRYPIEDWKIVKSPKKIKVKSKLKI